MLKETAQIWRRLCPVALNALTAPPWCARQSAIATQGLMHDPQNRRHSRRATLKKLDGRRRRVSAILVKLSQLSHQRDAIPHQQFLEICGDAAGHRRAAELAQICYQAGLVFRLGNRVYTSKEVIHQALRSRLPYGQQQVRTLLADAKAVLEPMERRKSELDRTAHVGVRRLAHVGLSLLTFQLLFFMRLTFVELSWDVMEPVAYFTSVFVGLVGYGYFLKTYGIPKYAQVETSLLQKRRAALYRKAGFKIEVYENLQKRAKLYESYLAGLEPRGMCNKLDATRGPMRHPPD